MDKLEALEKQFPNAKIEQIDDIRFNIDGNEYSLYNDDELEAAARKNIQECFENDFSDEDISGWVKQWGGYKDFYNEEYINDFRIEDSETYGDMSDNEIIDELEELGYFETISRNQLDMEKMVDFVWDYDGAMGISHVDGNIEYVYGF